VKCAEKQDNVKIKQELEIGAGNDFERHKIETQP